MKKLTILLLTIIIVSSCKNESQEDHIDTFPVEVQDLVRSFLKEGETRGHKLNIKKIHHIYLVDKITDVKSDNGNQIAGDYNHKDHSIYIDTTNFEWKQLPGNYSGRESTVCHELGHGLLHRDHRSDYFTDGLNPKSFMNPETLPYWNEQTLYKKQYYFDELFHQNTPWPDWAK